MSVDTLRDECPKRTQYEHDAEMEKAKVAFLAARTPFARRKALRKLEQLRAALTASSCRPYD